MAGDTADPSSTSDAASSTQGRRFAVGLGRGFGGALIFSLPMLMTMEMWSLGMTMDRYRLALLLAVNIPLLILLSNRIGFERTPSWADAIRDASIAYGIGILCSLVLLTVFGILTPETPFSDALGKVAVQSVPSSIGALLGRSQFAGDSSQRDDGADDTYAGELFLMAVGALFLGLNVAPTEEMILISYRMGPWHSLVLLVMSIGLMHGFVYAVAFKGGTELTPETPWWSALVRFTLPGYLIAALISFYVLWTFGRTDASPAEILSVIVVLAFPSALGAAAARLIL